MVENNKKVKVTNRDNGRVGYTIPDLNNLVRTFAPNETKELTMEEIRKLSYIPGGKTLLKDYLIVHDEEAIEEVLTKVEPEYFYTEEDVKNLLLNGSLDALKDCLDYAPVGTIDLVKKVAVAMPLNDVAKRKAILEMTGFDVDTAVAINEATRDEAEAPTKARRVTNVENNAKTENKPTGRRTTVPGDKYTVIK